MRSTWSLERGLALLAAATLEAAWLTLAYVLIQWLAGNGGVHLGIVSFGAAALFGLVLARAIREWPRSRFAAALVGSAVVAAVVATFFIGVPTTEPGERAPIFAAHAGGFLLGLAVWRGSLHAELGDEAELSESLLKAGVPGLIVFWLIATGTRMVGLVEYTAPAFVATLAFIGSGLLSLGLARLVDLEVEQMDRGARRRWVTLTVAISGLVLILAVPIAAVLGVPVADSIEAVAGPLAPLVLQAFLVLSFPLFLIAQLIAAILLAILTIGAGIGSPLASPPTEGAASPPPTTTLPPGVLDVSWLGIVGLIAVVAVALMIAAALARPPGSLRRGRSYDEERSTEPVNLGLAVRLPRFRRPRLRRAEPRSAVDAYLLADAALRQTEQGRQPTETPREHATRLAAANDADMRRLAADYQLAVFAGAPLTAAEERRAIGRWRRIARRVRRLPRRSAASEA